MLVQILQTMRRLRSALGNVTPRYVRIARYALILPTNLGFKREKGAIGYGRIGQDIGVSIFLELKSTVPKHAPIAAETRTSLFFFTTGKNELVNGQPKMSQQDAPNNQLV